MWEVYKIIASKNKQDIALQGVGHLEELEMMVDTTLHLKRHSS